MSDALPVILALHQSTSALRTVASDLGDDFLLYIFEVALRHIEENAEPLGEEYPTQRYAADDPAIAELAAKIRSLAKAEP